MMTANPATAPVAFMTEVAAAVIALAAAYLAYCQSGSQTNSIWIRDHWEFVTAGPQ